MRYGYKNDTRQKQIEQEFKARMSFDQAIDYYTHIIKQIESKWSL